SPAASVPLLVTTAGPVVSLSRPDGSLLAQFQPYAAGYTGEVRVAVGDVSGDGIPDIITATGPGGGSNVKVFSGRNLALLQSFTAYGPDYAGGLDVAAGDVNGDGRADIVTGLAEGGGNQVKVFSGKDDALLLSFEPFGASFTGGTTVAVGDVNADGKLEIIAATATQQSFVEVFSGQVNGQVLQAFLPLGFNFATGLSVAAGRPPRGALEGELRAWA